MRSEQHMDARVALVTGGSQGIGEAICQRLAADGHKVIVASRSRGKIEAVAEKIRTAGGDARAYPLDVTQIDSFKEALKDMADQHGAPTILVNNAGITADNLMMRIKPDDFDRVVETNLRGSFFLSQALLRYLLRAKWGRIINISSVVGLMGNAGQANYAATKAGMIGVTKSLAREIGSRGITVNAVAPGYIETEMTADLKAEVKDQFMTSVPARRFGTTAEVAHAVSFLASDLAGYINGQVLTVDGGMYM
jgi:3-oxoacyl-[acyl-carrier protein] reductase